MFWVFFVFYRSSKIIEITIRSHMLWCLIIRAFASRLNIPLIEHHMERRLHRLIIFRYYIIKLKFPKIICRFRYNISNEK